MERVRGPGQQNWTEADFLARERSIEREKKTTPGPWRWSVDTMENHAQQSLGYAGPEAEFGYQEVLLAQCVRRADRVLVSLAPNLLRLREIEWSGNDGRDGDVCPACGVDRGWPSAPAPPHAPDCWLGNTIAALEVA